MIQVICELNISLILCHQKSGDISGFSTQALKSHTHCPALSQPHCVTSAQLWFNFFDPYFQSVGIVSMPASWVFVQCLNQCPAHCQHSVGPWLLCEVNFFLLTVKPSCSVLVSWITRFPTLEAPVCPSYDWGLTNGKSANFFHSEANKISCISSLKANSFYLGIFPSQWPSFIHSFQICRDKWHCHWIVVLRAPGWLRRWIRRLLISVLWVQAPPWAWILLINKTTKRQ